MKKKKILNVLLLILSYVVLVFCSDRFWLVMQVVILALFLWNKIFLQEEQITKHSIGDTILLTIYVLTFFVILYTDKSMVMGINVSNIWIFLLVGGLCGLIVAAVRLKKGYRNVFLIVEILVVVAVTVGITYAADVKFDKSVPKENAATITNKWTRGSANDIDYYIKTKDNENESMSYKCGKEIYMQFDLNESVIIEDHDGFFRIHWYRVVKE